MSRFRRSRVGWSWGFTTEAQRIQRKDSTETVLLYLSDSCYGKRRLSFRRMWIVSVAVSFLYCSVPAFHKEFRTLVFGDFAATAHCILFCIIDGCGLRVTLSLNFPTTVAIRADPLVFPFCHDSPPSNTKLIIARISIICQDMRSMGVTSLLDRRSFALTPPADAATAARSPAESTHKAARPAAPDPAAQSSPAPRPSHRHCPARNPVAAS